MLGRYLYIEASNRQAGDKARLQSGWFLHAPELCLQFWYHMYGEDIGSLNIYIGVMKSEEKVWSQQGNQGDRWIFAQVPINSGGHERQFQVKQYCVQIEYFIFLETIFSKYFSIIAMLSNLYTQ